MASSNTRCPANSQLNIPLTNKNDTGRRSPYITVIFSIPGAAAQDEIVVALGAATGGRPHHRIGHQYSDLKSIGRNIDNPAGI